MSSPTLPLSFVPLTGQGFPVKTNQDFLMLLSQGAAGGEGTKNYNTKFDAFADFTNYLYEQGDKVYNTTTSPIGTSRIQATHQQSSLTIDLQLNDELASSDYQGTSVVGMATVSMQVNDYFDLEKMIVLGVQLAEIPAGLKLTQALVQSLIKPLLQRLSSFVQSLITGWVETDATEAAAVGLSVEDTTLEIAEEAGEELTELVVEEAMLAELSVDFSIAAPAFIALGILIAVPIVLKLFAKQMSHHLQITNLTDIDFTWSVPYTDEGAVSVQPQPGPIPAMSVTTDMFGDQSDEKVAHQADFNFVNTSGYNGIGYTIQLQPTDPSLPALAVVVSIPFLENNAIWVGAPDSSDWNHLYHQHNGHHETRYEHGNDHYIATLSIDYLSGNSDVYSSVLRLEPIGGA